MKIYFCDGCNESVPLADIQAGRVTTIKGKLFCASCIPPQSVGALVAPAEPVRHATHPLLVGLLVLLLGWTLWRDWGLLTEAAPADDALVDSGNVGQLAERLETLESRLAQVVADEGERGRLMTSLRGDLEDLRATDADMVRSDERLADDIDRLARAQALSGQLIEKVQLTANRVEAVESRLDGLSDAVTAHQAALDLRVSSAPTANGGAAAAAIQPGLDPSRVAALDEVRRLLLAPEPDLRFEGVDRVEEAQYKELAPELVGLLKDEDMFVRMHAMNVLGNFGHEQAVPVLFEVLDDGNAAIRKVAAETLVRLTGYDPGYDHKGSPAERARVVKKWTDWYAAR